MRIIVLIFTDKDEIQDEQTLKTVAPPSTAQAAGAIELIFGLGVHQVNENKFYNFKAPLLD